MPYEEYEPADVVITIDGRELEGFHEGEMVIVKELTVKWYRPITRLQQLFLLLLSRKASNN